MTRQRLTIVPLSLSQANDLVASWHRHHKPLDQAKFCVGVVDESRRIVGAAIVGRPVARLLDDTFTLEVNRCVTDGTPNACSALYGAVARTAKALGYSRVYTYTREDEPGDSMRGAGWTLDEPHIRARSWNMPGRPRVDKTEIVRRKRWLWQSGAPREPVIFPDVVCHKTGTPDLFAIEAAE